MSVAPLVDPPLVPPPAPPPDPAGEAKRMAAAMGWKLVAWFLSILPNVWTFSWLLALHLAWFAVMGCVYGFLVAKGLMNENDDLAALLHKAIPSLSFLGGYLETRKLAVAHVLAGVMLLAVTFVWEVIIHRLDDEKPPTITRMIVFTVGPILLVAEAICFWIGIRNAGTFGGGSALIATVLTVICACVTILFAAFVNSQRRKES